MLNARRVKFFYDSNLIFLWIFAVVVIVVGIFFVWGGSEFVIVTGVGEYIEEGDFSGNIKFSSKV